MKTIRQVDVIPVYVEFVPEQLEEGKIYISEEYKVAVHNCLCGCKSKTVTPLGQGEWNITKDGQGRITMSPSIGNFQMPCRSHYIITKNKANFV